MQLSGSRQNKITPNKRKIMGLLYHDISQYSNSSNKNIMQKDLSLVLRCTGISNVLILADNVINFTSQILLRNSNKIENVSVKTPCGSL